MSPAGSGRAVPNRGPEAGRHRLRRPWAPAPERLRARRIRTRRPRERRVRARRLRRLGLRARLTAAFALGAFILATAIATSTYGLTRRYLLDQRESSATRQAYVNAALVRDGLRSRDVDVPRLLNSLETGGKADVVVERNGRWYATSLRVGRAALPAELRAGVLTGAPQRQVYDLDGDPVLVTGIPLPEVSSAYFEATRLSDLDTTLRTVSAILATTATAAVVIAALVGWATSGRVLAPVAAVAQGAVRIAEGHLDTRLSNPGAGELGTLVRSFNRMADSLERRIERDRRFTADVSHELRSPLTALSAAVGVLEGRRNDVPTRMQGVVDLLRHEVDRFQSTVESLLELARADAGGAGWEPELLAPAELVLHLPAVERLPVTVDATAVHAYVRGDKRRIEQLLRNLIDNADRHGGGVTGLIVTATPTDVRLLVEDAGPGVPDEFKERVFERFTRGPGATSRSAVTGTGLGLALVAEHVRGHDGTVWIEDRPGGGCRFVVSLPRVATQGTDPREAAALAAGPDAGAAT